MKIKCNNVPRYFIEPSEKELEEFDWLSEDDKKMTGFFRYKGSVYHTSQFVRIESADAPLNKWHGQLGFSYFSGLLVKLCDDCESLIVAYYTC